MKLVAHDGITHINIYSKGQTELGRMLTNWAFSPFVCEDGEFSSIEGYWYWLSCKDDSLRHVYGYEAKKLGKELRIKDWVEDPEFKEKIKKAIRIKIKSDPKLVHMLAKSVLPLRHYYVYGDKVVEVDRADWILEEIEKIRQGLKKRLGYSNIDYSEDIWDGDDIPY